MIGKVNIRVNVPASDAIHRHTLQMSAANLLSERISSIEIRKYTPIMTRGTTNPTAAARAIDVIQARRNAPHLRSRHAPSIPDPIAVRASPMRAGREWPLYPTPPTSIFMGTLCGPSSNDRRTLSFQAPARKLGWSPAGKLAGIRGMLVVAAQADGSAVLRR
jgi:hypothetical protein